MPLNPTLYRLLCERIGPVKIAKEGMAMIYRRGMSAIPDAAGKRGFRTRILSSGEEYRVSCPDCGDTRFRLWINHRWGVPDADGNDGWWLLHCYNEECQSEPGFIARLRDKVFGLMNRDARAKMRVSPGERRSLEPVEVEPPGAVIPLDNLEPDHVARLYLASRGFDPDQLSRDFGIGYCSESHLPMVTGRIIVPMRMHNKLVEWQGRYVGELDWRLGVPKYYSCPGVSKNTILYNFDTAKNYPFVVVVEGCTDVWRTGQQAVALLGKNISVSQLQRLTAVWGRGTLVLMLDADAWTELEGIERELSGYFRHGVVKVFLPAGSDPGSMTHERIWELIVESAHEQKINLLEHLRRVK